MPRSVVIGMLLQNVKDDAFGFRQLACLSVALSLGHKRSHFRDAVRGVAMLRFHHTALSADPAPVGHHDRKKWGGQETAPLKANETLLEVETDGHLASRHTLQFTLLIEL